jgi:tripartite motif-containing protein 71
MKKVIIINIITITLFFSCYFDAVRENANDPRSSNYAYYFYTTQWGSYGTGNGQFNNPNGIAVDSAGNVYVADTGNNRVQKFTSNGDYITQWGSSSPYGIAVDFNDNVYLTFYGQVQKFTSNGDYITQWGGLSNARGIAVDSSDNIYVIDNDNYRVQKFTSSGTYITQWGGEGFDNGQFDQPEGIAVDSNDNIYVSDSSGFVSLKRVQKFTSSGTYITQWGSYGTKNGQFSYAMGIAIDSDDNIYVADSGSNWDSNNRVQKFTPNGVYICQWGNYGSGNGKFNNVGSIALDSNLNVYVTDSGNNRVQKFHYRPRP